MKVYTEQGARAYRRRFNLFYALGLVAVMIGTSSHFALTGGVVNAGFTVLALVGVCLHIMSYSGFLSIKNSFLFNKEHRVIAYGNNRYVSSKELCKTGAYIVHHPLDVFSASRSTTIAMANGKFLRIYVMAGARADAANLQRYADTMLGIRITPKSFIEDILYKALSTLSEQDTIPPREFVSYADAIRVKLQTSVGAALATSGLVLTDFSVNVEERNSIIE